MTVSRVLRNRGDVSEATREKVLAAAKELGYVPNKIAGALASNRVNLVAVIIPSLSNMVFPEVLTGINQVLEDTELQPVVGVTDYLPEKEEKVLYEMLSWRPSGVIIAGIEHTEASKAMMQASGIDVAERVPLKVGKTAFNAHYNPEFAGIFFSIFVYAFKPVFCCFFALQNTHSGNE